MIKFLQKKLWRPSISFGVTVNNEAKEIKTLLDQLLQKKSWRDEIIVLQDVTEKDEAVSKILDSYKKSIIRIEGRLNGDFAAFKNLLIKYASKEYLFQIDADELLSPDLIKNLKILIKDNQEYETFLVPRINTVEGIEPVHVEKWNWKLNEKGYINYPDYQQRIFKNNGRIFWKNKVHEELYFFNLQYNLPAETEKFCLLHHKTIAKQTRQNEFYEKL